MSKWFIYLNLAIPIFVQFALMFIRRVISPGAYSCVLGWTVWIVLPLILTVINLFLFFCRIEVSFLKCCFFMLLGLSIGTIVGYVLWGISTKRLLHPDGETIDMIRELIIYYTYFVGIFFLIVKGGQFLFQVALRKKS